MIKIYDLLEGLETRCQLAKASNERVDAHLVENVIELIKQELQKHNTERQIKIKCVRDLLEYCE